MKFKPFFKTDLAFMKYKTFFKNCVKIPVRNLATEQKFLTLIFT